jgi:hypothetical protein
MEQVFKTATDAELASIREAAAVELAQMRGEGTNSPAADNVKSSGDAAETEDSATDAVEPTEKAPEKDEDAPADEGDDGSKDKEEQKPKSEDDIRKEVERQAKRKYLSQINQLKKQLEEKQAVALETKAKYQNGEADDIEAIVEAKIAEREFSETEKAEKKETFYSNPAFKEFEAEISDIKENQPNLSWKESALLWAAMNKPELLVKPKAKTTIKGDLPKSATSEKPATEADLKKDAEEYYRRNSSFFER